MNHLYLYFSNADSDSSTEIEISDSRQLRDLIIRYTRSLEFFNLHVFTQKNKYLAKNEGLRVVGIIYLSVKEKLIKQIPPFLQILDYPSI